ncbi:MAG: hypothetical protein JRI68_30505 [Deltaproteobacteria bacterium]|nr:hypothetical protein [Deltaproteobacteria bacterium]
MPLAFRSRSHGTVAFGFFNIESDMLLLEQMFFFADRFCRAVVELAWAVDQVSDQSDAEVGEVTFGGWQIDQLLAIGNLHGAIEGRDLSGFIGASYRKYPFPERPEDFKQSPFGAHSQPEMTEMIECYGRRERYALTCGPAGHPVRLGAYEFDLEVFAQLIDYVEHGGHPRYRKGTRPDCVRHMMAELGELSAPWLERPAPSSARPRSEGSSGDLPAG